MQLYNIVAMVLANSIDADKRIKGIRIGDHEIKTVNFADNTTIFLRDRIKMVLKLHENELVHINIELINQTNWNSHNLH